MRREVFRPSRVALAKLDSSLGECARKLRSFEKGSGSSEKDSHIAAPETLERLDSLSGDFCVRLRFSETFPWRIEGDGKLRIERLEIGQPPLGGGDALGYDNEKTTRTVPG
jgi:hypothetical protein